MSILPEADWERNREIIRQLYCIEDKKLECVQEEMKQCYGFNTTKSQYGKYLKRWKFRKNLSIEEWVPVRHKVLARKREGKESEVYLEGVLMPSKKVKRGIGRYQQTRSEINLTSYDRACELQTPNGVTIATPIPIGSGSNLFGDLLISQYFASLLYQAGEHLDELSTDRLPVSSEGRNTIYPASHSSATAVLSMHPIGMPRLLGLPHWPPEADSAGRPRLATGTRTSEVRNDIVEDPCGGFELLQTLPENIEAFRALQSMIFLASNHFLDSADLDIRKNIINWLGEGKNASLLRQLLSVGGPTAESTLEALYPYALHGRSTDIVKIFIDLGCDPNFSYIDRLARLTHDATTALGSACAGQNFELVCLLLTAGADPNKLSRQTNDDEPICPMVISILGSARNIFAAPDEDEHKSALQLVETLMQSGALVHGPSALYRIPLNEAVRHCDESVVRFLINKGADVNLMDGFGERPLGIAIENFENTPTFATSRSLSIVQLLLNAGADLNGHSIHYCYRGHTEDCAYVVPFDNAALNGCLPLLELLHAAGARPGCFALSNAIGGENEDIVKFTLHAITIGNDSQAQSSALVQAVQSADGGMFRLLFHPGTNQYESHTLILAIQKGIPWKNHKTIEQLLHAGRRDTYFADKLKPAAIVAISSGDLEILDLVLGAGVKVNSNLLVHAFKCSREPIIKRLLDLQTLESVEECAEESEDEDEDTVSCTKCGCEVGKAHSKSQLLDAAAGFGNCEIVKYLLEQGARLYGTLPLICAVRERNLEMVAMLLETGSPISDSACDGKTVMTPLQAAVLTKQSSLVRILLDSGADPEVSSLAAGSISFNQGTKTDMSMESNRRCT